MATPLHVNEAVPEHATPTKLQRVPCTTYPVPLPSPDSYNLDHGINEEDDMYELPLHDTDVKWYDSDEDSYSSRCP